MTKQSLCHLIVILFLAVSAQAAAPTLQSLKSQTKFEAGEFEKIKGPEDACQADLLSLSFEGDDHNVVLRLGERFIFSHLEQSNFLEPGLQGCKYKLQNQVKEKFIQQTINHDCPKKSDSMEKVQTIQFKNGHLVYDYQVKGQKQASFTCEFSKAK